MTTNLARQISTRMKAKNISISSLEREAGLKTHAVRNIIRGKSKKPSAEIMQAIADVLGCTVRDLLENHELFEEVETENQESFAEESMYANKDLLAATVSSVNTILSNSGKDVTVRQALTCVEEVYLHALKQGASEPDSDFATWFIDLIQS